MQNIFSPLSSLLCGMFAFFVPILSSNLGTLGSCCGSTLWVPSLLLSSLCPSLLSCLIHVAWFMYMCVWVMRNSIVVCWVSAPEGDWHLCSSLCKLFSKVLLNCHWCMPSKVYVSHKDSANLHHSV